LAESALGSGSDDQQDAQRFPHIRIVRRSEAQGQQIFKPGFCPPKLQYRHRAFIAISSAHAKVADIGSNPFNKK
jgi:hypothetical protein